MYITADRFSHLPPLLSAAVASGRKDLHLVLPGSHNAARKSAARVCLSLQVNVFWFSNYSLRHVSAFFRPLMCPVLDTVFRDDAGLEIACVAVVRELFFECMPV